MERIGLAHLFEDQLAGPSSPLYWVLLGLFLILLLASLYVYLVAGRRFAEDRFHRRLARRYAALIGGLSGLGLASSAFALLAVPFLSKRIWLVAAILGLLATAGYGGFYIRRRYAAARRSYEERARRQRYLPRARPAGRRRKSRK